MMFSPILWVHVTPEIYIKRCTSYQICNIQQPLSALMVWECLFV